MRLAAAPGGQAWPADLVARGARTGLALAASGRQTGAVRLLFAGDVMLGCGAAPVAEADPNNFFVGIRFEV